MPGGIIRCGAWLNGGLGGAGSATGLDDLKGFFQPKQFSDTVTPKS